MRELLSICASVQAPGSSTTGAENDADAEKRYSEIDYFRGSASASALATLRLLHFVICTDHVTTEEFLKYGTATVKVN